MKQVIFFAILFASIMVYASPTIKKDDDKANIEGHIFDAKTKIPTEGQGFWTNYYQLLRLKNDFNTE